MKKITKRTLLSVLGLALTAGSVEISAQQAETFSVATLNVDGLPQKLSVFKVNAEGPGSAGTVRIGKYLKQKNYDLVFMQEDFNYHPELEVMLEDDYQLDAWSGDVDIEGHSIDFLHLQNHRFECDGLMACWKNGITATAAERTAWNDGFGKFSHANDEMVTKGFRRYEVTLASGTRIVAYNMHMDAEDEADSEAGNAANDRAARLGQWVQLREDIMNRLDDRPVIVVGDMNSFYFRDRVKEQFIDAITATGKATVTDAWIELQNKGDYPEYKEDSKVRDDAEAEHGGESLDKVFCIIPTGAQRLKAVSYSRDNEGYSHDGKALGDHYPVVVTFEVVRGDKETNAVTGVVQMNNDSGEAADVYDFSGRRVVRHAKGLYIERKDSEMRKRIIK